MQLRIIILSCLLFVAGACSTDDPTRHNTSIPLTSIVEVKATYQSMADKTVNQYTAIGDFSGMLTRDITDEVSWSIADNSIAAVSNATGSEGLVTALFPGTTTITAFYGDISGDGEVVVTDASVAEIETIPDSAEVQVGLTQQYEAVATFSDGSVQDITLLATWESSDENVATIDNAGLATILATGTSTISGTWEGKSGTSLLIAGATLTAITITPEDATASQGTTVQFEAEGTFSDDTTIDVTDIVDWESSAPAVAEINAEGLADAVATGEANISASFEVDDDTVSATTLLTVTDTFVKSISLAPANETIALGTEQQFTATATFSDDSQQDITELADWFTNNDTVGTISNFSGIKGFFNSTDAGTTVIQAVFGGIDGQTLLTVE